MISREAEAIIGYVEAARLSYRVTDVSGPGHAPGSYHYATGTDGDGLAVDFAGLDPGVTVVTAAQMLAIYVAFFAIGDQLAELIYSGSGVTKGIKGGKVVDGRSFYGPLVWPDHRDHVHVAVERGTILTPPVRPWEERRMADDPNLPNLPDILGFYPVVNTTTGECTGYYILAQDGELHAYGPGAKFYGRSEVVR